MIPSPSPVFQFFKADGSAAVDYKLYTYLAGTTTAATTYQDATGTTPHTNPIILDVNGSTSIFIDPNISYKYILTTQDDALVDSWDNVKAHVPASGTSYGLETVVISNDSASITEAMVMVDTEGGGATDSLSVLTKSGATEGTVVFLSSAAESRVVTVLNGSGPGNISTVTGENYELSPNEFMMLRLTSGVWREVVLPVSGGAVEKRLTGTIETHSHAAIGFKNKLVNGDFSVWQDGETQTSSGYGSDDCWLNLHSGTTKTHSRQSFAVGQTDVPGNPKFFSRTIVSTIEDAANYCSKEQRIEGVRTFAGETATLSFYAKADAAKSIAVDFKQDFGTSGSPSAAEVGIGSKKILLTTEWQRYVVTVDVPSISGKQIGTDGNDYLAVTIWFDAGSNYNDRTSTLGQQSGTFDLALVQLEKGDAATDFDQQPPHIKEALCYSFYYKFPTLPLSFPSPGAGGYAYTHVYNFPVPMRVTPSIGWSYDVGGSSNLASITVVNINKNFAAVQYVATGAGTVGWTISGDTYANARL